MRAICPFPAPTSHVLIPPPRLSLSLSSACTVINLVDDLRPYARGSRTTGTCSVCATQLPNLSKGGLAALAREKVARWRELERELPEDDSEE